ncbi:hypothetical protein AVEN_114498-1, partial [Araneus ventricosus]
ALRLSIHKRSTLRKFGCFPQNRLSVRKTDENLEWCAQKFGYSTNLDVQPFLLDCWAIKQKCVRCKYMGGQTLSQMRKPQNTAFETFVKEIGAGGISRFEGRGVGAVEVRKTDSRWICVERS